MAQITIEQALQQHRAGQLAQAEDLYRQILARQPNHADANNNLGVLLQGTHRLDEAVAAYRRAIAANPNYAEAHSNLGVALREQGKLDDALAAFGQAIIFKPNNAASHNNLGMALKDLGQLEDAIAAHRKAIALDPRFPQAHASLGNALIARGQIDEAIAAYRQAIAIQPDFANAHYNLGKALVEAGQVQEAHGEFVQASEREPDNSSFDSAAISCLHYCPAYDGPFITAEHSRWNRRHAEPLGRFIQPHTNDREPNRRLRIGYVSPDFRNHPVGRFLLPLLDNHDHQQFEIFCYSDTVMADAITVRFQSMTDHWRDATKLKHEPLAEQIRADAIDILVDLCGHTTGSRLLVFAQKPAPVQISYLGYPGTTGMTAIDYRLTDSFAEPPGMTEHLHAETLFRLPRTNWCFAEPAAAPLLEAPPMLRHNHVTFGSFSNFAKVTDVMLQAWAGILQEMPGSRLLLKAGAFASANTRDRVERFHEAQGIRLDRVTLLGPQPDQASHLATYNQIDIALDTFPYHGTATTCEALWMGVPVISLAGQTHVSRVGVSLLSNIGLPEMVATTPEEYRKLAVALANDPDRLNVLRSEMRQRMRQSPLMDARGFARNIEAAYRQMWERWCEEHHRL